MNASISEPPTLLDHTLNFGGVSMIPPEASSSSCPDAPRQEGSTLTIYVEFWRVENKCGYVKPEWPKQADWKAEVFTRNESEPYEPFKGRA